MNLGGVHVGDLVLIDKRGSRFHAEVTDRGRGELSVRPLESWATHHSATAREVVAHWRKSASSRC